MNASGGSEMETLTEAIARLERRGFDAELIARPGGLLERDREGAVAPETLVVEEIVRFEGTSDPQDEAVLFALRSEDDRLRGTFLSTYGPHTGPENAAVLERLRRARSQRHGRDRSAR